MLTDYPDLRQVDLSEKWDEGRIVLTRDFTFSMPKYTQYIFFYKNHKNSTNFLPDSVLRDSLAALVTTYYPPLGGWFETDKGEISLVWNKNNMNMPVFTSTVANMDYSQLLKEATLRNDVLIPNSPTGNHTENNGRIPLFLVKVTRLKDNSALTLSISYHHMALDGTSVTMFLNNWGNVCKQVMEGVPSNKATILRTPLFGSLELDRYVKPDMLHNEYKEFIRVPVSWNGWNADKGKSQDVEYRFSVSIKQQEAIRDRAHSIGVSFNSLLCAMVWREINRLRLLRHPEIACERASFGITMNARKSLGVPDEYCSCAAPLVYTDEYSIKGISSMNPDDVAGVLSRFIKKAMTSEYLIGSFNKVQTMYCDIERDAKATGVKDKIIPKIMGDPASSRMVAATNVHFPIYETDFGAGKPVYIRPSLMLYDGAFRVWPGPSTSTGEKDLEIYMVLNKDIDIAESEILSDFVRDWSGF